MDNILYIKKLIKSYFPFSCISAVYGYGSGFYPTNNINNNMIDLLFIVPNLYQFHMNNKKLNFNHYSLIDKYLNKSYILNNHLSQVYYNQNILIDGYKFKYGIIDESTFKNSLLTWSNFFICGRFHKPIIKIFHKKEFDYYLYKNRKYAYNLVSLMNNMNDKFKFYYDIVNLSYIGDIRNKLNLDNNKKKELMVKKYFNLYDSIYNQFITNKDINLNFNSLPLIIKNKLGNRFIDLNMTERRNKIIKLLTKINKNLSYKALLMGLYSSPDIKYIYNKINKIKYYY